MRLVVTTVELVVELFPSAIRPLIVMVPLGLSTRPMGWSVGVSAFGYKVI